MLSSKEVGMARPKTEAATYEMVTFRVPPKVLARVRRRIKKSRVPLNTELIDLVKIGLQVKEQPQTKEESYVAVDS
jgi:hypothetical protein